MQTHDFLSAVLGGEGFNCVFGANPAKKRVIQKLYPTIEAASEAATNLCAEGFDAYYGLAKYKTDKSRRADNAATLKSFFLDIDCGPHKTELEGYPGGQPDGLAALRRFCKSTGLPRPTLVNSGNGLHVYWVLNAPVPVEDWIPVAERLKQSCVTHNLVADPAVTADVARVLRVPGTSNFKRDPAAPVQVLGEIAPEVSFEEFKRVLGVAPKVAPQAVPDTSDLDDVSKAILGNYKNSFKRIVTKTASGNGCEQIKLIIAEQDSISEPLWRGGLSIAKFCEDGDKAVHKISEKHPGYSPQATVEKVALIKGPYTCETFEGLNPSGCEGCPHKGHVKSPITLGRIVQEAQADEVVVDVPEKVVAEPQQYIIPRYPSPYFRGINGGVFKRAKDKEGDPIEILVYHNDIYITRRLKDPELGEAVVVRLHLPKDGVREFTIPLASMLSKDEFRKYMAMNGVAVIKMDDLMTYMTSWVNKLQAELGADIARRQFGWTDDTFESFVVGNKEIKADRIDHNPPSNATAVLFGAMQPKGSLEEWIKMANFYNRPGMEMHQYVVALSFGSPLVAFSPEGSALFHMHSKDPGLGKTTAMKVANSIWGHPNELMSQERDTTNSKWNRAEMLKNIFFSIDELTNMAPKDASDFLYQLTGFKQRNRLSVHGNTERFRGEGWKMNVTSTGNTGLVSRITLYKAMPKAETTRVLECNVKPYAFETKSETDQFVQVLKDNYGHACVPYMQFVLRNLEEAQNLFKQTQEKIDIAAGLMQPHRFWSVQAASAIAGLVIARRLNLVSYPVQPLFDWIVALLKRSTNNYAVAIQSPEEVLTSYLAENYNNILRIKSTDDSRVQNGVDPYIIPDSTPRAQLIARYEYDVKKLYLLPKPLKEWCNKQQIDYPDLFDGLKKAPMHAVMKKQRLGKGTKLNLPPVDAMVLDCTSFMSDEREEMIASAKSLFDTE